MKKMTKFYKQAFMGVAAAGLAFGLAACGDDSSSSAASSEEVEVSLTGVVFTSDYTTGELRWIDKEGKISENSLSFYQDSKVFTDDGDLYVLEAMGGDNISKLDPEKLESEGKKAVTWQVSLDDGSNPVDLAVEDGEAWVALQAADSLVKISTDNGKILKSINTGKFAQDDVSPYVADIEVDDGNLYVLMQRYVMDAETWVTTYPKGLLAIYDASTGDLKDTVQLKTKNPSALIVEDGAVYVATHGEYNASYGTDADDQRGIEKVNVSKKSSSLYISGEELGGGVAKVAVDDDVVYVSINLGYDENFNAAMAVKKVDLASKKVEAVKDISDASGSMDVEDGVLYVGDRTASEIVVWDGSKKTSLEQPKGALPPYSIALF